MLTGHESALESLIQGEVNRVASASMTRTEGALPRTEAPPPHEAVGMLGSCDEERLRVNELN
jgi:hypothetical protein